MNILTWSLIIAGLIGLGVLESRNHAVSTFLATFMSYWVQETKLFTQPGT